MISLFLKIYQGFFMEQLRINLQMEVLHFKSEITLLKKEWNCLFVIFDLIKRVQIMYKNNVYAIKTYIHLRMKQNN